MAHVGQIKRVHAWSVRRKLNSGKWAYVGQAGFMHVLIKRIR